MDRTVGKSLARKIFWYLLSIAVVLIALHLLVQYLNVVVYQEKHGQVFEISNRFDVDDEASVPTWFSQFLLLLIAGSALLASRFERVRNKRRLWFLLAIGAVVLSVDEVSAMHEFILQSIHLLQYGEAAPTAALNAWVIVIPFLIIGGGLLLWWLSRALPKRTLGLFFISGLVYMCGAAGFELFSNDFAKTSFMYQGVLTAFEEGLEMLGSGIGVYAVWRYLETQHGDRLQVLRELLHQA